MLKKVFLESYGCQMNFSDSEIIASILSKNNYDIVNELQDADLVLLNTCAIRDKAEQTIRKRLFDLKRNKKQNKNFKIGILGCMAERLKSKLLEEENLVDLVVGPDAYRDLPSLLKKIENQYKITSVKLSKEETYDDIIPMRINKNKITALISITRGCDNMCTFCVVPFTRGRERSRNPNSIIQECEDIVNKNYKEVIFLGQNVDSYIWFGGGLKKDFNKQSNLEKSKVIYFSDLLIMIAEKFPNLRIRFITSNPQDMDVKVFHIIKKYSNICKHIHLPIQSGSNIILQRMNRQHTREEYLELIKKAKKIVPDISFSYDIITGFCGETEEDHLNTLSLIKKVEYNFGYMFSYSHRPGTLSYKKMVDDVPNHIKKKRLIEIINLQQKISYKKMKSYINNIFEVLIEGNSKKNDDFWSGRNSQNLIVIFKKVGLEKIGDFVQVKIYDCTSITLFGYIL